MLLKTEIGYWDVQGEPVGVLQNWDRLKMSPFFSPLPSDCFFPKLALASRLVQKGPFESGSKDNKGEYWLKKLQFMVWTSRQNSW